MTRVWKSGNHEVLETVLRRRYEPRDEMALEEAAAGAFRWTVLSVERHPHGWRTIATRCLPGCREHPARPD